MGYMEVQNSLLLGPCTQGGVFVALLANGGRGEDSKNLYSPSTFSPSSSLLDVLRTSICTIKHVDSTTFSWSKEVFGAC